ncbi:MAG: FAD:protein FMN transferase [Ruminococcaceae bacterium]|nr:FAD:protein FMN transferase [Oscillospiraceae bacterium]
MRKFTAKIISFVLLISLFTASLSSCAKKELKSETALDWFDTVTTVSAPKSDFEDVWKICSEMFEKYDKLFDIYNEYDGVNNVCTVNKNAGKAPVVVEKDLFELLEYSKEIYSVTNGKVNVAMGSVLKIWHSYREAGLEDSEKAEIPSKEELSEAAKHIGINAVELNTEELSVYINDENVSLDVGAIAKGFAVEKVAKALEEAGYKSVLISAGGNVRAVGTKPGGEKWKVGISDPNGGNAYPAICEISDASVVTSGSYQRFYTADGKKYHHIIDPETLFPSEYFVSVSVCLRDSGLADALSTALFLMNEERGRELCESVGAEAFWIYDDGKTSATAGFPK